CFFGLSFSVLLPAFARDVLDVGPTGQGLLVTAMGLGALASALVAAAPSKRGRVMSMFQQSQVAMTAGGVLAGGLAAVVGSPLTVVLMGIGCMMSVGLIAITMP